MAIKYNPELDDVLTILKGIALNETQQQLQSVQKDLLHVVFKMIRNYLEEGNIQAAKLMLDGFISSYKKGE